jgi:deazaflavin-dependent oxidoreductase (nitroreductase family)
LDRWTVANPIFETHKRLYRLTGGTIGHRIPGGPSMLLLDSVGAKTGTKRTHALVYLEDGDDYVVIASKAGWPTHPGWYHNLRANPDTSVQVGSKRLPVHAHVATPDERKRLWPRVVDAWRGYATYQKRTDREIPLVILSPR